MVRRPSFFARSREVCQQLSVAGANVHALNCKGQSSLHLAAYAGLEDVVSWLVANMKGVVINQQDKRGRTALYCALKSQKLSTVTILHEHGADLTLKPSKYSATSTPARSRPTTADRRRRRRPASAAPVVGSTSASVAFRSSSASFRPASAPFRTEASASCRSENAWKDGSLEVVPGSLDWMSSVAIELRKCEGKQDMFVRHTSAVSLLAQQKPSATLGAFGRGNAMYREGPSVRCLPIVPSSRAG